MSFGKVFSIAGSGMSSQLVRLNTIASNLSNSSTVSSTEDGAYRAKVPVFAAGMPKVDEFGEILENTMNSEASAGVQILGVVESAKPVRAEYNPNHPQANGDGYIYRSTVSPIEEMANMMSASRSYQTNVQIMETSRDLMMRTIRIGQ